MKISLKVLGLLENWSFVRSSDFVANVKRKKNPRDSDALPKRVRRLEQQNEQVVLRREHGINNRQIPDCHLSFIVNNIEVSFLRCSDSLCVCHPKRVGYPNP